MIRQRPQFLIGQEWVALEDLSSADIALEGSLDNTTGFLIPDDNALEDVLPDTVTITGRLEINLKKWTDRKDVQKDPLLAKQRPEKLRCTWEYEDKDTWQTLSAKAQMFNREYDDITDKTVFDETARLADDVTLLDQASGVYRGEYVYTLDKSDVKQNDIDCRLVIDDGFDVTYRLSEKLVPITSSNGLKVS